MRLSILLILIVNAFHVTLQAQSIITKNCAQTNTNLVPPAFANFSTLAQRRARPELYAQTVETVIRSSPFKNLLDCRDRLKSDPRFNYSLRFLGENESQMMSVTRGYVSGGMIAQTSIELTFDLKSSPQKLLFAYIHELTHVCQALNWSELHAKYDIVNALRKMPSGGTMMSYGDNKCRPGKDEVSNSNINDDYIRHRKLGEVEAFYQMTKAYQHFTGLDSSFCKGTKDDGRASLYDGYLEMEAMISQGYFAQDIVVKYQEEDSNKKETAAALFDLKSPKKLYPDGVLRPALNRELLSLIKGLGMPVVEPK